MATDPNLASDNCIVMEDGPAPNWWLSNDVIITNPASGVAQPGMKNDIRLTVRRSAMANCTMPEGTDFVKVDLYVCNPTGSPFSTTSPQVKKILDATTATPSDITVDLAHLGAAGASWPQTIKWDLPALSGTSHPAETAGHKCLVARAYPNALSGNVNLDFVVDDQHYAQRNICILTCSSPCGLDLWTENPKGARGVKNVTFRVVADQKPSAAILNVALPHLRQVAGFRQVVNIAPRKGFALELPDFPGATRVDNSRPGSQNLAGCLGQIQQMFKPSKPGIVPAEPYFDANVQIQPGQLSFYKLVTDLEGAERGDAHVLHLMHMEEGRVLSGLTILAVKV